MVLCTILMCILRLSFRRSSELHSLLMIPLQLLYTCLMCVLRLSCRTISLIALFTLKILLVNMYISDVRAYFCLNQPNVDEDLNVILTFISTLLEIFFLSSLH